MFISYVENSYIRKIRVVIGFLLVGHLCFLNRRKEEVTMPVTLPVQTAVQAM